MKIHITHDTRLDYTSEIVESVSETRLGPRSDADQNWHSFELRAMPGASVNQFIDGFGNTAHLVTLSTPHRYLEIVARSSVYTLLLDPFRLPDGPVLLLTAQEVREGAQFFEGLVDSTMMRGEDWNFAQLGMYLERADNVARALHLLGHLLEVHDGHGGDETVRWLAVLRSCGSAEAYARYYSLRVEPARVVEFVLLNPVFPQSVRFSLSAAHGAAQAVGRQRPFVISGWDPAVRALGSVWAILEYAAVDELIAGGLRDFLEDLRARIANASDQLTAMYLTDLPVRSEPSAAERAAMIMAVQQQ